MITPSTRGFPFLNTKRVLCRVSVHFFFFDWKRIRIHFWRVDNTISIQIILCISRKNTTKVWHIIFGCIISRKRTTSSNVKANNNSISQQQFYMKHLKCKFITLCCLSAYYSFGDRQCLVFLVIAMNEDAKKKEEKLKTKNKRKRCLWTNLQCIFGWVLNHFILIGFNFGILILMNIITSMADGMRKNNS